MNSILDIRPKMNEVLVRSLRSVEQVGGKHIKWLRKYNWKSQKNKTGSLWEEMPW